MSTRPPSWAAQNKRVALILGGIFGGLLIICCVLAGISSLTGLGATALATATPGHVQHLAKTNSPTATTLHVPTATVLPATATPKPTATLRPEPTATSKPKPKPTATPCPGVNCNPWGYNFNGGSLIYSPPSAFCDYFDCIASFWNGSGFVIQCNDGTYSKSGGKSGACSDHGGERRPLYS